MADLATDQTITYNAIPTNIGLTKIQLAMTTGVDLILDQMAFGDGGGVTPEPSPDQTSLVNQLGSVSILGHEEDLENNVTWYSAVIEAGIANGTIRELGLFDKDGNLCFVGNIPDIVLPSPLDGVTINIPIQLGIKNYYSKYISIKTHIKITEQIEGSGGYSLFDLVQKDHLLSYEESEGFALQGTWVYKEGLSGSYYGYPDFIEKCIEEKNSSDTVIKRVSLGDETITGYVHPNGHIFYDIADKDKVDTFFNQYGIAWFYGLDEENKKVFLPRNNYFFKNALINPGEYNTATLPSLAHTHQITMSLGGAHVHSASVSIAGEHSHTITMGNAGNHQHTITITSAGSHNHTLTIYKAGSHSHDRGTMNITASGFMGERSGGNYTKFHNQATGALYYSGSKLWGSSGGIDKDDLTGYFDASRPGAWTGRTSEEGDHTHSYAMGTGGAHIHSVSETTSGDHIHTATNSTNRGHIHDITLREAGLHAHTGTADIKEIVNEGLLGTTVTPPSTNMLLYIVVGNVRRKSAMVINQQVEEGLERIEEATQNSISRIDNVVEEAIDDTLGGAVEEAINDINDIAQGVEQHITEKVNIAKSYAEISEEQARISEYWAGIATDGQVQADWDETNPSAKSYIKNKPDLDLSNIVYLNRDQILTNKIIDGNNNSITNLAFNTFIPGLIVNSITSSATNNTLATSKAIWDALNSINILFTNLDTNLVLNAISANNVSQDTLATSKAIWDAITNVSIQYSNLDHDLVLTALTEESISQDTLATSKAIWDAIYALPTANMSTVTDISTISDVSDSSLPTSLAVYTAIQKAASGGMDIVNGEGISIENNKTTQISISTSSDIEVESSYTGTQPDVGVITYVFTYVDAYNRLETTTSTSTTNPDLTVNCYYTGTQSEVGTITHTFTYVDNEYGVYWEENGEIADLTNYDLVITGEAKVGDIVTLIYTTNYVSVPAHWVDSDNQEVSLAEYDLTITSGTPVGGDTITLTYVTSNPVMVSIDEDTISNLITYKDTKGAPNYVFQNGLEEIAGLKTEVNVAISTSSDIEVESSYTGTQPEVGTITYIFVYRNVDEQLVWVNRNTGEEISLAEYDLTITSGTPVESDRITLTYKTRLSTTVIAKDLETTNFKSEVIRTSIRDISTASDTTLATEKAVRQAINDASGGGSETHSTIQTYQSWNAFNNGSIILQDDVSVYSASADITTATTFTFDISNLSYLSNSVFYTFEVKFTMSTVSTLSFPDNVVWQDGETPTFDEVGTYLLAFRTMDAGSTFIGNVQGKW